METGTIILIAGLVGGGVLLIVATAIVIYCLCYRRRATGYEKLPLDGGINGYLAHNVPIARPPEAQAVEDNVVMGARFYLRSTSFTLVEPLLYIGGRRTKSFFLIKGRDGGPRAMSATKKGPRAHIQESNKRNFRNAVAMLQHPLIDPILDLDYLADSGLVIAIRNVSSKGTLKDMIYGAKWKDNFDYKYRRPGKPLPDVKIALYGKQILQALLWLEQCKYPFTHLHSGNVIVDRDVCCITELELPLLKIERHYEEIFREFAVKSKEVYLLTDLNVLAFGCLLFEMAVGRDMISMKELEYYPTWASQSVKFLLERIFRTSKEVLPPSLQDLWNDGFFLNAQDIVKLFPPLVEFGPTEKEIVKNALKANSKFIGDSAGESTLPTPIKKSNRKSARTPTRSGSLTSSSIAMSASPSSVPSKLSSPRVPSSPSQQGTPQRKSMAVAAPVPEFNDVPTPPANNALLNSISGFNPRALKKTVSNDRSAPVVK